MTDVTHVIFHDLEDYKFLLLSYVKDVKFLNQKQKQKQETFNLSIHFYNLKVTDFY